MQKIALSAWQVCAWNGGATAGQSSCQTEKIRRGGRGEGGEREGRGGEGGERGKGRKREGGERLGLGF